VDKVTPNYTYFKGTELKNIIFDMDGTLINSGGLIVNTINHVRENIGLKPMQSDVILRHVNDPHVNPAMFFYETEDFTPAQTELFEEYYDKHFYVDLELYDGIDKLLDTLKDDYWLSIATNANDYVAKKMLEHLEIDIYFETIIGANNVAKPKPSPDMVTKIIEEHSLQKSHTVLIGDSPKDAMAASSAGIESILVNWGFTDHDGDDVLHKVDDIITKLKTLQR
jgi:phosphoglycolate phosphatase